MTVRFYDADISDEGILILDLRTAPRSRRERGGEWGSRGDKEITRQGDKETNHPVTKEDVPPPW